LQRIGLDRPVTMQSAWRDEEERANRTRPVTMQSAWRDEEERAISPNKPLTDILLRCRGSRNQVQWSRAFGSPTSQTC
jgi:hypothetical protein